MMLPAKDRVVARGTVTPPDRSTRSDKSLRSDLEARGLPSDGDREALVLRLETDNLRRRA